MVVALVLTFAAGWQVGKVMSPYYAAQPIVFREASCDTACTSPVPQASAEALNSLLDESRALQADTKTSPRPTVAAAVAKVGFVGSINSDLYHDPSCPSASRIKLTNQVWFASREEAERAGYSPSKCTKEKLGL